MSMKNLEKIRKKSKQGMEMLGTKVVGRTRESLVYDFCSDELVIFLLA